MQSRADLHASIVSPNWIGASPIRNTGLVVPLALLDLGTTGLSSEERYLTQWYWCWIGTARTAISYISSWEQGMMQKPQGCPVHLNTEGVQTGKGTGGGTGGGGEGQTGKGRQGAMQAGDEKPDL